MNLPSPLVTELDNSFQMRYVAAYLLATLGGNKEPSASDIEDILSSVGIEADKKCLDKVLSELKGKDIDEVRTSHFLFLKYLNLKCLYWRAGRCCK